MLVFMLITGSLLKSRNVLTNVLLHAFLIYSYKVGDNTFYPTEILLTSHVFLSDLLTFYFPWRKVEISMCYCLRGKEYIIMLSSNNLGHVVDGKTLSHLIRHKLDQCMEVISVSSDLEESDPLPHDGKIESREKLKFTNTMWVSMGAVRMLLETQRRDLTEKPSISEILSRAYAINIPKSNHIPVGETSDLLLLKSDLYILADGILSRNPARENPDTPSIYLGPEFQNVNDFHLRFKSIPSIIGLESLAVTGDVWFGDGVTLKGKVIIDAVPGMKIVVPDGAVLGNKIITRQEVVASLIGTRVPDDSQL
ncbi:hypothetical protein Leryth_016728 [Lithospermum erythrorhizon]|nr:hypothetical protein Leryth_016728 [Lithospermum erythrorhizon]